MGSRFAKLLPQRPSYPHPSPPRITVHAAQLIESTPLFGGPHESKMLVRLHGRRFDREGVVYGDDYGCLCSRLGKLALCRMGR